MIKIAFGLILLLLISGCGDGENIQLPPDMSSEPPEPEDINFPEKTISEIYSAPINILTIGHIVPNKGGCELNPIGLTAPVGAENRIADYIAHYCPDLNISQILMDHDIDEIYYIHMKCDVDYDKKCVVAISENRPNREKCSKEIADIDYHGRINETCYFWGCKDEYEKELKYRMKYGDFTNSYVDMYIAGIKYCLNSIEEKRIDESIAHEYNCLINETKEEIWITECSPILEVRDNANNFG